MFAPLGWIFNDRPTGSGRLDFQRPANRLRAAEFSQIRNSAPAL